MHELPEGWEIAKVKDVALDIQYGYTESSSKNEIGPKFLRITDIQDNHVDWETVPYCKISEEDKRKKKLEDGDLVFARTGATVGKSFLIRGNIPDAVFASYLIRLRFPKTISVQFVYNFFQSPIYWNQIVEGQVGIGQPNVNGTKLGKLEFPLPPLPVQQAIVTKIEEIFSELDHGVEQLKLARQQLKVYRQSVLKWAFEGRLTNLVVKDGELPDGWKWVKIEELCNVVRGGSPRPAGDPRYYDGDIPFLKVADLTKDSNIYLYDFKYTIKQAGLHKTRKIQPKTLLLSNSGATLGIPKICMIEATMNDGIAAFLGLDERMNIFLYYFWLSKTEELRNINMGAAQPNLNTDIIKNYKFPLPPLSEQHQIVAEIERRLSVCDKLEETIEGSLKAAEVLRAGVLKRAFEGRLV